jgi:signal peptide peptidase SppA
MKYRFFSFTFLTLLVGMANHPMHAHKQPTTTPSGTFHNLKNSDFYPALALAATPLAIAAIKLVGHATEQIGLGTTMLLGQALTAFTYYQYKKYFPVLPPPITHAHSQLGYIVLTGSIQQTEKIHEILATCLKDSHTHGIIIKIDALGGSVGSCQTLYHEIKRAASIKPVVAIIEKYCCREAYLVASAANHIIANEQAIVGIIGTSFSVTEHKQDPSKEVFSFYAGKLTPIGDTTHHMTAEDQQVIAQKLEKSYEQICRNIAEQRNLSMDRVNDWADGKPFIGTEALHMQLIDQIGTLSDAYEIMNQLLKDRGIEHGPLVRTPYPLT